MKFVLFIVCVGLFCMPLATQGQVQKAAVALVVTGNKPTISVSNNHTVAMEAFLVTVKHPSAEKLTMGPVFYDVYTNYRRDQPISPGAQHQIALPVLRGQEPPVATLQAAIFADGSSWGDPARVQEILYARQVLSDRLSEVSALLQTIAQQKPTREQALAAIQTAWDAKKKATPNLPIATADEIDEIEAVDASEESTRTAQVYYHVISNLQRNPAAVRDSTDVTKFLLRMSGTLSHWNAEIQAAKPLLGNPK